MVDYAIDVGNTTVNGPSSKHFTSVVHACFVQDNLLHHLTPGIDIIDQLLYRNLLFGKNVSSFTLDF